MSTARLEKQGAKEFLNNIRTCRHVLYYSFWSQYFNYGLNVEERTFLNLEVKAMCRSQFDSL